MSENRQKGTGMEKLFENCRLVQISDEAFRQNAVFVVGATCGRPRACEARPYGLFGGFDAKGDADCHDQCAHWSSPR